MHNLMNTKPNDPIHTQQQAGDYKLSGDIKYVHITDIMLYI